MGDARQQLLPALLVPAGALHRFFQPGGHLVKRAAHRRKLVLPGIGDSEVQIALPQPAGPFAQQVQGLFDLADHKPGEKAVGHQDGEKHHKNHPDGRQRKRDPQPTVQTALTGPEQIQGPGAALVFSAGPVNAALPGRDEHLGLTDADDTTTLARWTRQIAEGGFAVWLDGLFPTEARARLSEQDRDALAAMRLALEALDARGHADPTEARAALEELFIPCAADSSTNSFTGDVEEHSESVGYRRRFPVSGDSSVRNSRCPAHSA